MRVRTYKLVGKTSEVKLCEKHRYDNRFGVVGEIVEPMHDDDCDACTDDQERAAIQSEGA